MKHARLYFEKLWPQLLVFALLIVFFICLILPNLYNNLLSSEKERYLRQIQHMNMICDQQIDIARSIALTASDISELRSSAVDTDPASALEEMRHLRAAQTLVSSVALYFQEKETVLTDLNCVSFAVWKRYNTASFNEAIVPYIGTLKRSEALTGLIEPTRPTSFLYGVTNSDRVIVYMAPIPYYSDTPYATLLITINADILMSLYIKPLDGLSMGLLRKDGSAVFIDNETGALSDPAISELLSRNKSAVMLPAALAGQTQYLTITPSTIQGLYYVSALSHEMAALALGKVQKSVTLILSAIITTVLVIMLLLVRRNVKQIIIIYGKLGLLHTLPTEKPSAHGCYLPIYTGIASLEERISELSVLFSQYRDTTQEMLAGFAKAQAHEEDPRAFTPESIETYLLEHLIDPDLSAALAAEHFGMAESTFSAQFKKSMGQNYLQYVNMHKINLARRMLADRSIPLSEIARRLNYANTSNFSRMFKSIMSLTPGQYRNVAAEEDE